MDDSVRIRRGGSAVWNAAFVQQLRMLFVMINWAYMYVTSDVRQSFFLRRFLTARDGLLSWLYLEADNY